MSDKNKKTFDASEALPDPDMVGTTEYLALHDMLSGAGHLDNVIAMERSKIHEVIDALTELAVEAQDRRAQLRQLLRR